MTNLVPSHITPTKLAEELGVSRRFVCDAVRQLGCFCQFGQKVVMFDHHVAAFMEAMECRSNSSNETRSGITEEQLPVGDYGALRKQRTKKSRKGSRPRSKQKLGNVVSMDQAQR